MSYDLFVFDPSHAPTENEKFLEWFDETMDRSVSTRQLDFAKLSPKLAQFYQLMQEDFPDMNPADPSLMDDVDPDDPYLTDYTFTESAIYLSFAWSASEDGLQTVLECAIKTGVGFFDVSSDDGVIARDVDHLKRILATLS